MSLVRRIGAWRRGFQIASAVAAIMMAVLLVAVFVHFSLIVRECQRVPENCDQIPYPSFVGLVAAAALLVSGVVTLRWRLAWPLVAAWGAIGAVSLGEALYFLIPSVRRAYGLTEPSPEPFPWYMLHDPFVLAWFVVFLLALPALSDKSRVVR